MATSVTISTSIVETTISSTTNESYVIGIVTEELACGLTAAEAISVTCSTEEAV